MFNFHLRREALERVDVEEAGRLLRNIEMSNKDDCLSTKLVRDWLISLKNAR